MDVDRFVQGGIWWYMDSIPDKTQGERGITRGDRPILIISEVSNTIKTCTMTYLPISKMSATAAKGPEALERFYAVPIEIPGGYESYVVCNQPTTGVTNHLRGYIGQIKPEKMKEVQQELLRYMGMLSGLTSIIPQQKVESEPGNGYSQPMESKTESLKEETVKLETSKRPHTRKIRCLSNNKVYDSLTMASQDTGIDRTYISKIAHGKVKKPGVYFEYVD